MAPKNKGGDKGKEKGKGKGKEAPAQKADEKLKGAQSVEVRHILCKQYARKEEALAKLKSGSKFIPTAEEFSEDKARKGGYLGWKKRNEVLAPFAEAAFQLKASTSDEPVLGEAKTDEGYHIIMVMNRQ